MKRKISCVFILLLLVPSITWSFASREDGGSQIQDIAEIDWFVNEVWFSREWDSSRPVDQVIEESTGTRIRFLNSAGGISETEKLNSMIASKDLPDVLSMGWWYSQFQQLMTEGLLLPLDQAMPMFAPEMWSRVPASMKKWYTFDDGNWYGFPSMYWDTEQFTSDNYLETNGAMVARKDIMDELGIEPEDFATQDGMINALRKVRDARALNEGNEMRPLYLTPNGGFPGTWVWDGFWAMPRENSNGEYVPPWHQREYLEQIYFANRLFNDGLLSVDNWTANRDQIYEKILAGDVFAMICNRADYEAPMVQLTQTVPGAEYVPVGPVRSKNGNRPYLDSTGSTGWLVSMIAKDTEKADKIFGLWDFLYSVPGLLLTTYGIENETYKIVDGVVQWTPSWIEASRNPKVDAEKKYGNDNLWFMHNPVIDQRIRPNPTTAGEIMIDNIKRYFGEYTFDDTAFKSLDPPGGTEEFYIWTEIERYWEDQETKMVLASSPSDAKAIYENALSYIDSLGFEKVLASRNRKFQENKNKLGLAVAWPSAVKVRQQ